MVVYSLPVEGKTLMQSEVGAQNPFGGLQHWTFIMEKGFESAGIYTFRLAGRYAWP